MPDRYCCAMCELERHPIPTEIQSKPDLLVTLMGGTMIGFGLWAGFALVYLAGKFVASFGGWWPLLWILVGTTTAAGLWSETTGRRR